MLRIKDEPFYRTSLGEAYLGDSLDFMRQIPTGSVNLVMTSPPFALKRKKNYGNVEDIEYVEWLYPFAEEIHRILKDDGSFVIDIGAQSLEAPEPGGVGDRATHPGQGRRQHGLVAVQDGVAEGHEPQRARALQRLDAPAVNERL